MVHLSKKRLLIWILIFALSALLSACGKRDTPIPTGADTPIPLASDTLAAPGATSTPFQPSPTPTPAAALVNGDGISLAEYEAELARYRAAHPGEAPEAPQVVLDELVAQVLLAQAAAQAGFSLDDAALQARLDKLTQDAGGEQALSQWMASNGYTVESFKAALRREASAAWMRDQVTASVPANADQVHAQQILLYNSNQATQVLRQIESGTDFATLAWQEDPVLGGELGWFSQGYLLEPAVEEAAFALQPGETSAVIETRLGFHIVQVIERDPQRPLDPDARRVLQGKALTQWLDEHRSQSDIQIFVPEYTR